MTVGRLAGRARHQRWLVAIDAVVAALLTLGGLLELATLTYAAPVPVAGAACVVCTASVAVRRQAPVLVAVAATIGLVVYQITTNDPDGSFIAPAVVLVYYSAGRSVADRAAWRQLVGLGVYSLGASLAIAAGTHSLSPGGAFSAWPVFMAPVAAGVVVARHARLNRRLSDATGRLRDEQRVRSDRMLGEERNRVARELHDVVAHHVSVMVIQAGAARLVAARDRAAASAALGVVEQSGREALTDLRRIMGVMRRRDDSASGAWGSLAKLDEIVARTRASGVATQVRIRGRLGEVPIAIDLVAYRIVQEALTNIVKHAPSSTASVEITVGPKDVRIAVTDDGGPTGAGLLPGSGHGLVGMRERVALYGGQLTSGRRAEGGFEVRAVIPFVGDQLELSDSAEAAPPAGSARLGWRAAVTRGVVAVSPWTQWLLTAGWLVALEVDALTDPYRRGPVATNVLAVLVMAIAFRWRRRAPLLFVAVVGSAALPLSTGLTSAHSTLVGVFCVTVPMFTLAAWDTRPRAIAGLVLWIAGTIGAGIAVDKPVAGVIGALLMSCVFWAAGSLWRSQRTLAARLSDTNLILAAERDDRERLAIAGERARIARELHHLVAQGVVAMIVSATAARADLLDSRDGSAEALASIGAIEETGREALARMRDILGVLRARSQPMQTGPQPGLGQLHTMIQRLRDAGRSVDLVIEGEPAPLPAGVDLTTYRIIEATLAAADPRPSRSVRVLMRYAEDAVEIDVTGAGLHLPSRLRLTVGERAALCHGTVLPPATDREASRLRVRLPLSLADAVAG